MAYEILMPEGMELKKPEPIAEDKNWMGDADAGYSDAFRNLKTQIDRNHELYQDQLATLPLRKGKLRKELTKSWFSVILFLFIIPVGMWVITDILLNIGTKSGIMAIVYLVFKILLFPVIFASVFFLLPPAIRTLVNCQRRYNAFNHPEAHAKYRDQFDIISFADEEHFLRQRLSEHAQLEERIRREHLDEVGGGEDSYSIDELSSKQAATLEEMQRMSVFRDYQARIGTNRVEGDAKYVMLGLGIGVFIALMAFTTVMID